jgi:hypothetical protein
LAHRGGNWAEFQLTDYNWLILDYDNGYVISEAFKSAKDQRYPERLQTQFHIRP